MTLTLFEKGRVLSPLGAFQEASILVSGGKIAGVSAAGDAGEPPPSESAPDVDRVDLSGIYVIPGFVDCHIHLTALALNKLRCDLSAAASARDVCEKMAFWAASHPDAPFLMGVDFDESRWENGQLPTKVMLDGIDDRRAVLVRRICGHVGVVNTALLKRVRFRPDLVDEEAGIIREHVLWEAGHLWEPDEDQVAASVESAIRDLHRLGITTIHDLVEPERFEAYVRGVAASSAPLRIDAMIHTNPRDLEYYRRAVAESGARDFRVIGAKCFLDGSLGARTAALNSDYADGSGWGTLLMRREVIRALAEECFEDGYVLAIHAIGDRAVDLAAKSLRDFPRGTNLFRIEHCEIAGPAQIEFLRGAPVVLSVQPNFVRNWGGAGGLYERRLGRERLRWSNRYRTFLSVGLPCVFGSDGMPAGPLYGLKGATEHPTEEERLTPEEALACCTSRPHAVGAHTRDAGTIEEGRVADFVLLDANPLTEDPDRIKVLGTIIDGEIVYDADADR
jgi:predicted amidohydrolase YtcJ